VDDATAAIFVETIQGEGGINPCTPNSCTVCGSCATSAICCCCVDEVQCGIGRTGAFYAFQHAGITPDAIGMAKGLGGGFPIGGIWVRDRHAELCSSRQPRHDVWRHSSRVRGGPRSP
jgi:acetylornithine aminotransferase/acetylornithine/N-succinyldiaminopimelate aminotransferase